MGSGVRPCLHQGEVRREQRPVLGGHPVGSVLAYGHSVWLHTKQRNALHVIVTGCSFHQKKRAGLNRDGLTYNVAGVLLAYLFAVLLTKPQPHHDGGIEVGHLAVVAQAEVGSKV